eukprot:TRINITY_DN4141_c0_g1_i1.p1 TRINITY_DN4141_c0_g1~~TRINITY_DN4141_c0_g1_i1.p1  ORF type:complete len:120 (-),score=13.05 TRINITY_DN4141_c0_g1_i1:291-650(-)
MELYGTKVNLNHVNFLRFENLRQDTQKKYLTKIDTKSLQINRGCQSCPLMAEFSQTWLGIRVIIIINNRHPIREQHPRLFAKAGHSGLQGRSCCSQWVSSDDSRMEGTHSVASRRQSGN